MLYRFALLVLALITPEANAEIIKLLCHGKYGNSPSASCCKLWGSPLPAVATFGVLLVHTFRAGVLVTG